MHLSISEHIYFFYRSRGCEVRAQNVKSIFSYQSEMAPKRSPTRIRSTRPFKGEGPTYSVKQIVVSECPIYIRLHRIGTRNSYVLAIAIELDSVHQGVDKAFRRASITFSVEERI